MPISLILFDLDGTLIDSAPDLAGAANHLRQVRGLAELPYEQLRKTASSGARGLLGAAFGITPQDANYLALAHEFLDYYEAHLADQSRLFDGILPMLKAIETQGLRWGIVTNKHARFTLPVIQALGLEGAATVVCGDTTAQSKPHPDPIYYALNECQVPPQSAIYVGDDIRDIAAGKAASLAGTIACAWGYLGCDQPITEWNADKIVQNPNEVLSFALRQ